MFFYRQVDPRLNERFAPDSELPPQLKEAFRAAAEAEKAERAEDEARFTKLTLEFYYYPDPKFGDREKHVVTTSKTATYAELLAAVRAGLPLEGVAPENLRLRLYTPSVDSPSKVINCLGENATLGALGIYSYQCFLVETRDSATGEFPSVPALGDREPLHLKAVVYSDSTAALHSNSYRVSAPALGTVGDLRAAVRAVLGLASDAPLRLATQAVARGPLAPLLDDTMVLDYQGARVYGGDSVYVEMVAANVAGEAVASAGTAEESQLSPAARAALDFGVVPADYATKQEALRAWEASRAFTLLDEYDKAVVLTVTLPAAGGVSGQTEQRRVRFGSNRTLLELRTHLADLMGHSPAEDLTLFETYRYNDSNSELTRLHLTLATAALSENTPLVVHLGRAPVPLALELYAPDFSGAFVADKLAAFRPLDLPTDLLSAPAGSTVREYCTRLAAVPAVATLLDGRGPECLRLRSKLYETAGDVYPPSARFKDDFVLYAKSVLLVEVLPAAEPKTANNELVLLLRQWHPSTLTLGPFLEVVLPPGSTAANLRAKMADIAGPDVTPARIEFARVYTGYPGPAGVLEIHDDKEWTRTYTADYSDLTASPLYLRDNHLLFFRDSAETPKELTEEERAELTKRDAENEAKRKTFVNKDRYSGFGKERGVKIKTFTTASGSAATGSPAGPVITADTGGALNVNDERASDAMIADI